MRDVNAFRERYKHWKETGELPYSAGKIILDRSEEKLVYENGLSLPAYGGGKDDVRGLLDYIGSLENPGRVGLKDGIWRPPTDSTKFDTHQIGMGLDIREEHNPIVYNYLKSKGRLQNPYLTEAEELALREQTWKQKAPILKRFDKKYNLSDRGYYTAAGMLWHGHPFKMMNAEDSVTGRALADAIQNGDRDLDTVFDAYYQYGSNKKRFASRISANNKYWDSKKKIVKPKPKSQLIEQLELAPVYIPPFEVKQRGETQYPISSNVPRTISSWSANISPAPKVIMPDLINIMDAYRNIIDGELPLNRPKFNDGKSKKLDVTETNVFDRVLDNNGDNLEWAYRKNWGNEANKKLFKSAYGNTEYMNVGEHKLPIYGSGPTWYTFDAGQLPEVIILPDNDTDIARLKMKNIVPNKELRHDILEMEDLNTDYGAINKLYDIWVASNRPKVMNGDILDPILQPIMSRGGYREHYNPLFNTIHLDEYWPSLLAELSHAYQYNAKELEHKPSFFNIPGDIKINGKDGYSRPGHMEYEAHSVIEPLLEDYINGNIHSLNEVNAAINAEKVNRSFNANKRYISRGPNKGRHFKKVNVFKKK